MKKTIQKKVSAIVWGIILFTYIALAFFYRERKDFDFFAEAEDKDTFAEMQTE